MPTSRRAAALTARALDIQREIGIDDTMATLPAWNSLAHIRLILELEAEIGRALEADEIASLDSVRAVAAVLGAADRVVVDRAEP